MTLANSSPTKPNTLDCAFSGTELAITGCYSIMDVRLLEAFRAVVDHRSVTNAAASAMGVTQPAVSAQIARLEQELGFALFERGDGRLKPTPEGMLFYAEANRALTGIDRLHARRRGRSARPRSAGWSIASHPRAAISLLPGLVVGISGGAAGCRRCGWCRATPTSSAAAAERELRHRHRRAADRRDGGAAHPFPHALRGHPAARHPALRRARR